MLTCFIPTFVPNTVASERSRNRTLFFADATMRLSRSQSAKMSDILWAHRAPRSESNNSLLFEQHWTQTQLNSIERRVSSAGEP
jgi:hypothetical protein